MSAMRVLRFASAARAGSGIEAVPLATDEVRVDVRPSSRSAVFRYGQHVSAVGRVFTRHNPLVSKSGRLSSRLRKKGMTTALLFSTRCAGGPLSEWKDAQEPSRAADCGPRRARPRRAETVPGRSRALGREGSNPDQVVRGEGKCKHPVHAAGAPVPRLGHQPDGFEPAEDLLHSLAPLLADRVARMPRGSLVNRAAAAMAGVDRQ